MTTVADSDNSKKETLARIKKNVGNSYLYFKENNQRYHDFRKYVFKSSINETQRTVLKGMNKPIIEFNILEAYLSRLLGEFSKHEPSIEVTPADGVPIDSAVLDLVEGHMRHILHTANKNSFSYEIYKDLLAGGFSVAKVWTDYSSPMSFDQQIYLSRVFDPTITGFDPMARASHKGDGQYSFEIYPLTEEDFKREYPNVKLNEVKFERDVQGFNWSYRDAQDNKIILITDYYEKKKRKVKILKLANGRVITEKNYKKLQEYWIKEQFIEQLPIVVGSPRKTELETICRYRLIETEILEYVETDYCYLPHVFVDGNSIILTQGTSNNTHQMTRPYIYHAKGVQDLKNFSGQCLANYLENLIQHKFIIMKEAIPQEEDYLTALNNIQQANTIVVNAFSEQNPDKAIPNPIREVVNVPAPPEVMSTFQVTEPTTQTILGSYASNLGQNDNDLSGKAVIESASVGNAAAMPYVVGYLQALTQIGNIIVDLMPKYLVGKRSIAVQDKSGEKKYQKINQDGSPYLDYDERAINVNIDSGVNFQVQKNQAMIQIIQLMQASEEFAAFMNSEEGLPILVDNLTVYGSDRMKEAVPKWMQAQQQKQQQQMQQQQEMMKMDPAFIRAQAELMKNQETAQQNQVENQIAIAQLQVDKEIAQAKLMEAESKISLSQIDQVIRLEDAETSRFNHSIDNATKIAEIEFKEHQKNIDIHGAQLAEKTLEHNIKNKEKGEE